MNIAVIGLGSNINPQKNIDQVRQILNERFNVLAESSFVLTKPFGYVEQDDFINGAVQIEVGCDQQTLNKRLKAIESEMGRKNVDFKYGPRIMDLDIIMWNDEIIDEDVYERDYLKQSVLELYPELDI